MHLLYAVIDTNVFISALITKNSILNIRNRSVKIFDGHGNI